MAHTSDSCIISTIDNNGILVCRRGKNTLCIDLSRPSSSDVLSLTQACEPIALDVERNETICGTYLNAWKMDCSSFIPHIDMRASGLEDAVQRLREGFDVDEQIVFEPHQLNMYGAGSYYKGGKSKSSHKRMFGTLVVAFPIKHEGGLMIVRQGEKEWAFDSGSLTSSHKEPYIAYTAFCHTAEHEILPVTYGYRITITYNLLVNTPPAFSPSVFSSDITMLKAMISTLIQGRNFLPDGGSLGFGLRYKYPIQYDSSSLLISRAD
ncbi:hypothetical protein BDQ17DRAFT_886972 [Cyathus striatus]|nr:hypothetical protein BDQ17DRAFT_886972 [Cyathus striatus]